MTSRAGKSPTAFRTISEVADLMGVQQHVLRFWESKFTQICPMKRGGGRRYYRPEDVDIIDAIRKLLHEDGYTIKGAQKFLKENGVKNILEGEEGIPKNMSETKKDFAQNDDEYQILNIPKNGINSANEAMIPVSALKDIRARLEKIRQDLKQTKA